MSAHVLSLATQLISLYLQINKVQKKYDHHY